MWGAFQFHVQYFALIFVFLIMDFLIFLQISPYKTHFGSQLCPFAEIPSNR